MDKQISKTQLRRESMRRWAIRALVAAAVVGGGVWALTGNEKAVRASELRMGTVDSGDLDIMVAANGRVVAEREEIVISPVSSRIVQVYAQPGDTVTEGTPMLMLDLAEQQAEHAKTADRHRMGAQQYEQLRLSNSTQLSDLAMQIEVQEMQVKALAVELANERRLDSLGSGTGDRVRQAQTSLSVAQLQLRQLREKLVNERRRLAASETAEGINLSTLRRDVDLSQRTLDQARVTAPITGVITYLSNEIGSLVSAGQKVAVVSDMSRFKVVGEVPEGSARRVAVGAPVEIRLGNAVLPGRVTNVNPQATNGTVKFVVRLDNPADERLRSGQGTELFVAYGQRSGVVRVPKGPFYTAPGTYAMFVRTSDGRLERRRVELGDSGRDYIEVKSGLAPGERVVVSDMKRYEECEILQVEQ